jgi:hypothetical protein
MNTPHFMTLGEASKAVGKSKTTISKYIKNGKLSVVSKDDDSYKIDPSELFRVFPPVSSSNSQNGQSLTHKITGFTLGDYSELKTQIEVMKIKLEAETKRADNLQIEKEDWKKQAQMLLLKSPEKTSEQKETEPRKKFLGIF